MTRIGILGASSQTGSSVAFFLKRFSDVQVTCFIRSSYSKVFFELYGIEYRYLDSNDEAGFGQAIGAMDVILDFGYPTGQLHEILQRSKESIRKVFSAMKEGGMYFYMSSIMAYGMPETDKWIRNYSFPRTSYAYIKRSIEKFSFSEGKKAGLKIYNFRLGQVHGFLQSVSGSFRKKLSDTDTALIDGDRGDLVNIIFIYPLCEAILQCIKGEQPPGLYTLVSTPQWTLEDLYGYYCRYYHLKAHLLFVPRERKSRKSLFQRMIGLAKPYRSILETYILMRFPALAVGMKGNFRRSELLHQRGAIQRGMEYIDYNLLGTPPLRTIPGLTTDPEKIMQIEKEYEEHYNSTIFNAAK